jgi:hypothetical protein
MASTARTAGEVLTYGTKDNGALSGLLNRPARKDDATCWVTEMPPEPSLKKRESIIGSSRRPPRVTNERQSRMVPTMGITPYDGSSRKNAAAPDSPANRQCSAGTIGIA